MWSYKAKRVCMCRRAVCVYVCMYVCVCVRMCRSVSVKTNLNAAVSGPKKRVTGVRYGLRADRLYGELRTNGAHEVRGGRRKGRAAAVDEAPHFARGAWSPVSLADRRLLLAHVGRCTGQASREL